MLKASDRPFQSHSSAAAGPNVVSMVADVPTIVDVLSAIDRGEEAARALAFDDAPGGWDLPLRDVHVWRASLARPADTVARMRSLLAAEELARADRFRFERDRSRYIVGRALLRRLLANYCQAAPGELTFEYGQFDKPALSGGPWFNLSHSGSVALYAFSTAGEIGIDVELERAGRSRGRVAERFFSPAEVSVLRALPVEAAVARLPGLLDSQGGVHQGPRRWAEFGFGQFRCHTCT